MKLKEGFIYILTTIFLLTLLFIVLDTSRAIIAYINSDELSEKTEWSILQGVEFQNRGKPFKDNITTQEIRDGKNIYLILGISLREGRSTWILLNPSSEPLIKQLPKIEEYELSKEDIDRIKSMPSINSVVMSELEKHQQ